MEEIVTPEVTPETPPLIIVSEPPETPQIHEKIAVEEEDEILPLPFSPNLPECSTPQWPLTQLPSSSSSPLLDFENYQFDPMDFLEDDFILDDNE